MLQIINHNLRTRIKQTYTKNILIKNIQKWLGKYPTFAVKNDYIIYKEFIYIALKIWKTVIKINYKETIAEYIRVKKTLECILKTYYFPEMRKAV